MKFLIAWNGASLHSPSPASLVIMLARFHKMLIQVGQAVKRDKMLP